MPARSMTMMVAKEDDDMLRTFAVLFIPMSVLFYVLPVLNTWQIVAVAAYSAFISVATTYQWIFPDSTNHDGDR